MTASDAIRNAQKWASHGSHYWWSRLYWPLPSGEPLDFKSHKYLKAIYKDRHANITIQKSGQTGLSEWQLSRAFFVADVIGKNSGYVFPTGTQLGEFVQMRVDPVIERSEHLSLITARSGLSGRQKAADKMGLKRVRDNFVIFRGGQTGKQLKSTPMDYLAIDEYDEMNEDAISLAEQRLNHSNLKWSSKISTPSIEGRGINSIIEDTDQHEWHITCPGCKLKQVMSYWDNVDQTEAIIHCKKCSMPFSVEVIQSGEWIAKNPKAKKRGYYISGLTNPYLDIAKLVSEINTSNESKKQQAYNQKLGLPYESGTTQLKDVEIDACQRDYRLPLQHHEYRKPFAGVDVGKPSYMKVMDINPKTKKPRMIGFHILHDLEADFTKYMNLYGIGCCVIDGNPETNAVSKLILRFPGRVFAAYYDYTSLVDGNYTKWYSNKVQVHRTASMDELYGRLKTQEIEMPKGAEYIPGYYDQLKAPKRVEDTIRGVKMFVYREGTKADHWAHADNYCLVAMQRAPESLADHAKAVQASDNSKKKETRTNQSTSFGNILNKTL